MRRFLFSRPMGLLLVAGVLVVSGCGKKTPPMAPVSGKVTVDGQPVTSGQVSFVPDVQILGVENPAEHASTGMSAGQITNGEYKIYTSGKEGAPLGKYKVTVTPSMVPTSPDAKSMPPTGFSKAYSDARSTPLNMEVIASPEPGRYDLKLKK